MVDPRPMETATEKTISNNETESQHRNKDSNNEETEKLWKNIEVLKTAVNNLDNSSIDTSSRLRELVEEMNEQYTSLNQKIDDLDQRLTR